MGTNYIAPMWRMPENTNKDKLSNYSIDLPIGSDNVSMGIVPNLFVGSWSISFWFKTLAPGAGNPNGCMVGRYVSANSNGDLEMRSDNGHVVVATGQQFPSTNTTEANAIKSITSGLNDGNWHHVAFSLDYTNGTSTRSLYIDGSLDSSDNSTTPPKWVSNTTQTLFLGQLFNNNAVYNGSINQVSIFDYAFDSNQVTYLYNLNNPMAISGGEPIAYYPLGDNSNPIANAGYPNISVGADSVFDFTPNDYIDCGGIDDLKNITELSISLWFNYDSIATSADGLVGRDSSSRVDGNWYVALDPNNSIRFLLKTANGQDALNSSTISANKWYHTLCVWDGTNMKIYLNGSLDNSITLSNATGTLGSVTDVVAIGRRMASSGFFNGEASNVQMWDTALQLSDAQTLYNNGQPLMTGTQPQASNLKAWYKLNQSSNWEADNVGDLQIPDATSAFPQSFKFIQANSDSIDVGSVNLGTENSISFWYNFNDSGSTQTVIGSSGIQSYVVQFGGNYIAIRPDGGNDVFYSPYFNQISPPYKTQGVWGHYLITRNGNTIRLFINGNEETVSGTGTGMGDTVVTRIGSNDGGGFYANAEISNVAFWNTDRSSEKDNIYNNGTPATSYTTTPQYWYKLDNTSVWNPDPANYWTFPNAGEQDNSGIFNFSN